MIKYSMKGWNNCGGVRVANDTNINTKILFINLMISFILKGENEMRFCNATRFVFQNYF